MPHINDKEHEIHPKQPQEIKQTIHITAKSKEAWRDEALPSSLDCRRMCRIAYEMLVPSLLLYQFFFFFCLLCFLLLWKQRRRTDEGDEDRFGGDGDEIYREREREIQGNDDLRVRSKGLHELVLPPTESFFQFEYYY